MQHRGRRVVLPREYCICSESDERAQPLRKPVNSRVMLFCIGAMLLSGCGFRQCLHTTMGCESDSTQTEKPCREFGGPTTGCHSPGPGAYLTK